MFTDPACKNAVCPPDKPRIRLSDADGLYLEVTPNRSKRWFAKYRFDGKEKRLALGRYPGVTLKAACVWEAATETERRSLANVFEVAIFEHVKRHHIAVPTDAAVLAIGDFAITNKKEPR